MKYGAVLLALVLCSAFPAMAGTGDGGVPQCSYKFEKIGSDQVKVGDFMSYFIRLENTSGCILQDLKIIDELPNRAKFESADPRARVEEGSGPDFGGTVTWRNIDLGAFETEYFEVRVHVVGPPDRTLVNKACLYVGGERLECVKKRTRVVTGAET